jgi:hypothetical protein
VEGLLRATRLECGRDGKSDVKRDVRCGGHEDYGSNVIRNQRGWCSIFNELSCHESITQKHPEESRDSACMNSRKDDKGGGALLEQGACGDKLKEEGKKVDGEKCTKFDTTDSGLSVVTVIDKEEDDSDTETTGEDIGDVADGIFKANAWDTAHWIDSYWGGCCIGRAADKKSRCMVLKLAIKEIAPRVRGSVPAERLKVSKTGHRLRVDWAVAESDRLDKNRADKLVLVLVPVLDARRGGLVGWTQAETTLMGRGVRADTLQYNESIELEIAHSSEQVERPPCGLRQHYRVKYR